MEACVVICRATKPKAHKGRILFINAVNEVTRERAQSFLTSLHIARIVTAYHKFKDELGFARVVSIEEIQQQGGNLNIPLYIAAPESKAAHCDLNGVNSIAGSIATWLRLATDVRDALTRVLGKEIHPTTSHGLIARVGIPAWLERGKWKRLPFGSFVDSINERVEPTDAAEEAYVGLDDLDSGSLHIRRWGKGSDVIGTKLRFRKGDLIFGRRRAYQRKLAVAEMNGICSAHAMVVRAKPEVVLPEFLPFLMMSNTFMNKAVEISVGSLSPTINWSTLKNVDFDVPSIDQQRRIAEILWAADSHLQATLRTADEATRTKNALLAEVLPLNGKFGRAVQDCIQLQNLCGEPITYGIVQAGPDYPSGIPYIRVCDMTKGPLKLDGMLRTSPEIAACFKRSTVRAGELVCALRGPVGLLRIVPPELDGANLTQGTARISLKNKVMTTYLIRAFESPFIKKQIDIQSKGSTFSELTLASLRELKIPLFTDKAREEFEFRIDRLNETESAAIDAAENFRRLLGELITAFFSPCS